MLDSDIEELTEALEIAEKQVDSEDKAVLMEFSFGDYAIISRDLFVKLWNFYQINGEKDEAE